MSKIRVCHLTSVHKIDDVRIFVKECKGLASRGFDVTIIAPGKNAFIDNMDGVTRISLRIPVRNRFGRITKARSAVYKQAIKLDAQIYHFHDPELLPIGKKLKKQGKLVIYDAHEDVPRQILYKEYIPSFLRGLLSRLVERIENYYARRMDAVVTVTEHIAKRFSKITTKVVVCHNYASLDEFDTKIKWKNGRESVCYIGGITKIRGIIEVAEAVENANVPLELAGDFESLKLKKSINFSIINYHGFISRKELHGILSKCFAGVVTFLPSPNHENACPNKIFEYMASSIPIIASNFEAWKSIIQDNDVGICVDPTNSSDIAAAILQLKNNPGEAMAMGLNGRKAFETKYNWQIEEEKLIALYNEIS